jgi:hypothetical protein
LSSNQNINNTGATTSTIDYRGSYTIKNVPSVNGPNLTTSNDTCMGSTSASANGAGVGISFGTTWTDEHCKRLKMSRELWNKGMKAASLAMDCMDAAAHGGAGDDGHQMPAVDDGGGAHERVRTVGIDGRRTQPVAAKPAPPQPVAAIAPPVQPCQCQWHRWQPIAMSVQPMQPPQPMVAPAAGALPAPPTRPSPRQPAPRRSRSCNRRCPVPPARRPKRLRPWHDAARSAAVVAMTGRAARVTRLLSNRSGTSRRRPRRPSRNDRQESMMTTKTVRLWMAACWVATAAAGAAAAPPSVVGPNLRVERVTFGSGLQNASGKENAEPVGDLACGTCRSTCRAIRPRRPSGRASSILQCANDLCDGYELTPELGRGEYLFFRPAGR